MFALRWFAKTSLPGSPDKFINLIGQGRTVLNLQVSVSILRMYIADDLTVIVIVLICRILYNPSILHWMSEKTSEYIFSIMFNQELFPFSMTQYNTHCVYGMFPYTLCLYNWANKRIIGRAGPRFIEYLIVNQKNEILSCESQIICYTLHQHDIDWWLL